MADTKIHDLTAGTMAGTDEIPTAISPFGSGDNRKYTISALDTFLSATTKTLTNKTLTSPILTTPTLGVAAGTSLALGGATIGTDALGVTGTSTLGGNVTIASASQLLWATDLILTRSAAAKLQLGAADVDTAPVAQTLQSQGALAGGTSNVAGANWTFIASPGKGTGAGGSFIFQTTPAGSTGTVVGTPTTALTVDSTATVTLASTGVLGFSTDTLLSRNGPGFLQLKNATNPTGFYVYNTISGANSEYMQLGWTSNVFYVGSFKSGSGSSREFRLGGTGTSLLSLLLPGSTTTIAWQVNASGHLISTTNDNTYDIGASGATRPRRLYLGTGITTAGGAVFLTTSTALTDGAGASVGTLTNAPAATNPTKWIGINDNGTTRYIPAW